MTIIVGIETSCDETGIAILKGDIAKGTFKIIAEKIHSQIDLHKLYGGVVPELAARQHTQNLPAVFHYVLKQAELKATDIDQIAVTAGPGLKGCLLTGLVFASGLGTSLNIPVFAVNHIEAHLLSVFLDNPDLKFPFIALIVSGGHTELHLAKDIGNYTLLARTIDDAAGEAFDKSARILGLPYPGGPELAALADSFQGTPRFKLPKVMSKGAGFSFSGLKTAISLLIKQNELILNSSNIIKAEIAAAIQGSIVTALVSKTKRAIEFTGCKQIAVVGGVSANNCLKKQITEIPGTTSYFTSKTHALDNGAMIALCSFLRSSKGSNLPLLPLSATPRWPIETSIQTGTI